jgi:acid stress-induced BolA-like protein IbaG/YrbA
MVTDDIVARIEAGIPGSRAEASGDSYRVTIDVVGDAFDGLSRVKRQQLVYGCINELIQKGQVHSVVISARTPAEADAR